MRGRERDEEKKYINHLYSLEGKEERVGEKEDGESQRLVYCVPAMERKGGREGGEKKGGRERKGGEGRKGREG